MEMRYKIDVIIYSRPPCLLILVEKFQLSHKSEPDFVSTYFKGGGAGGEVCQCK